jgi:general stress protein 26
MKEIGVALVVTHDGESEMLRARPMAAHPDEHSNAIYFLTDAGAPKDEAVLGNDNVCLTFSDVKRQRYVSVTGRADVLNDRPMISRFWSSADKAFWRDENDPAIRLFRVVPIAAEYWEGPGLIVGSVKMIAARATGARPKFHTNAKVMLSRASPDR